MNHNPENTWKLGNTETRKLGNMEIWKHISLKRIYFLNKTTMTLVLYNFYDCLNIVGYLIEVTSVFSNQDDQLFNISLISVFLYVSKNILQNTRIK